MSSLARGLSDGERNILAEIERDADPSEYWLLPAAPGDAREWGSAGDLASDPAAAGVGTDGATGPTAVDAAWKAGYDAGAEDAEQRIRELEYTIDRLETMLWEARAELMGRGR